MKTLFLLIAVGFLLFPLAAFATIGVGVGTGKIQVDEDLKPGIIYELPSLSIVNTGDEPADYEVGVSYHEQQPELRPEQDWLIFSPAKFALEPGEVQSVTIKLNLPVRAVPGEYFAYLEGRPLKKADQGGTSIGVAAASKLYFTVVPASVWEGIYYKLLSFWKVYTPWPQRVSLAVGIIAALFIFKRFFKIQVNMKGNDKKSDPPTP